MELPIKPHKFGRIKNNIKKHQFMLAKHE